MKLSKSIAPKLKKIIKHESRRQNKQIQLIASENFASSDVKELCGSIFTNKYAEGRPNSRYYNGTEYCDKLELYAESLVCNLFECNYANVQPHSGSNANLAVCNAFLEPNDRILSLSLKSGGHLSHGHFANISGKMYHIKHYDVDENGYIDYEKLDEIAMQWKPKMIISGASAYSLQIDWERIHNIARKFNAIHLADISHYSGLIAGGIYNNPLQTNSCDIVTSTTHKTLRGPRGGMVLWNNNSYSKRIHSSIFPGLQGGPLMHIIAAKAQCFHEASTPEFKQYSHQVVKNAKAFASKFKSLGYKIVSNDTDSHMFIIDLEQMGITGKIAANLLEENNIIVNKNNIPNDLQSPFHTSGIRLGTAAMTTLGWDETMFEQCAVSINEILFLL